MSLPRVMTHTFIINTLVAGRFLSGGGQPGLHKIGPKQLGLPGEILSQTKINKKNKTTKISFLSSHYNFFLTVNNFINHTFPDPNLVFMSFLRKREVFPVSLFKKFPLFSLFCQYNILRKETSKIQCLLWFILSENLVHYGWEDKTEQGRLCHDIWEGEETSGVARGAGRGAP